MSLSPQDAVAALARVVLAESDLGDVLGLVVGLVEQVLPAADAVSVTLIRDGAPSTPAATGPLAARADEHQYATGGGPCLDAARHGGRLVVRDLTTDTRWPEFAARAAAEGVRSSVSLGLSLGEGVDGALNVYSARADAFDHEATRLASWLADYVAAAVSNAARYADVTARADQLSDAMSSRAIIEQAKGMLMLLHGYDADAAFAHLIRESQSANRKLRDVAADIVEQVRGLHASGDLGAPG